MLFKKKKWQNLNNLKLSRAAKFDKHELGLAVFFFFDKIKLAFHTQRYFFECPSRNEARYDRKGRSNIIRLLI